MASTRDIKRRIKSVRNIQQITKAMKMVAAARIKKAEQQLRAARPYSDKLKEVVADLTTQTRGAGNPLLETRPLRRVGVVTVTSDKGLCGAYNNNLLRMAWHHWQDPDTPKERKLIAVGSKANRYLARRRVKVDIAKTNWAATFELASELADRLRNWFVTETVDQVVCFYTRAISAAVQEPVREVILPLSREQTKQSAGGATYEFEPSPEVALQILLPRYLRNTIYRILMEAKVSELGARLKAMTNATDNADKLADELTLQYFRLRQEGITRQILEISGGAEALKAST